MKGVVESWLIGSEAVGVRVWPGGRWAPDAADVIFGWGGGFQGGLLGVLREGG